MRGSFTARGYLYIKTLELNMLLFGPPIYCFFNLTYRVPKRNFIAFTLSLLDRRNTTHRK